MALDHPAVRFSGNEISIYQPPPYFFFRRSYRAFFCSFASFPFLSSDSDVSPLYLPPWTSFFFPGLHFFSSGTSSSGATFPTESFSRAAPSPLSSVVSSAPGRVTCPYPPPALFPTFARRKPSQPQAFAENLFPESRRAFHHRVRFATPRPSNVALHNSGPHLFLYLISSGCSLRARTPCRFSQKTKFSSLPSVAPWPLPSASSYLVSDFANNGMGINLFPLRLIVIPVFPAEDAAPTLFDPPRYFRSGNAIRKRRCAM